MFSKNKIIYYNKICIVCSSGFKTDYKPQVICYDCKNTILKMKQYEDYLSKTGQFNFIEMIKPLDNI